MELAACTSMAALAADSLAVIYSTCASRKKDTKDVWIRLETTHILDNLSDMRVDVIFGVLIRPANNTIWYSSCLHKLTLCLWQFWRLRLGDRRRCIGFNLEMNAMYANGSDYTNVSRCADIRFKVMGFLSL
ncbi:hypothetical protein Tco_1462261 [Tanacetum coccineum]